jgi:hypothetical protein
LLTVVFALTNVTASQKIEAVLVQSRSKSDNGDSHHGATGVVNRPNCGTYRRARRHDVIDQNEHSAGEHGSGTKCPAPILVPLINGERFLDSPATNTSHNGPTREPRSPHQ